MWVHYKHSAQPELEGTMAKLLKEIRENPREVESPMDSKEDFNRVRFREERKGRHRNEWDREKFYKPIDRL